ncbi:TPA: hypothetical protein ACH3X3_002652 [Trebouxia sp. C0006]
MSFTATAHQVTDDVNQAHGCHGFFHPRAAHHQMLTAPPAEVEGYMGLRRQLLISQKASHIAVFVTLALAKEPITLECSLCVITQLYLWPCCSYCSDVALYSPCLHELDGHGQWLDCWCTHRSAAVIVLLGNHCIC